MPALFIYLIKVNVALLIFCAGYYAILRHLTFYTLNRIYLVTAILFSTLYPRINLNAFISRHGEIARPIQVVVVNWQSPVNKLTETVTRHDQWYWLQLAFWAGVILFSIRLATQLLSLYRLHKKSEQVRFQHYIIRIIKGDINPFSFWRSIYINPDNHPPHELDAILEHEQIHVNEWHTLDILLGEVSAIFYWFNPGIWLMKKAIRENIEFITDRKILQKGMDCKTYQYSLINVNFHAQGNPIVNHFNVSTIKKRIIMMNTKSSSSMNLTRYFILVPAVVGLLLVFSVSKAELKSVSKSSKHMIRIFKTVVTKINFNFDPNTAAFPAHKSMEDLRAVSFNKIEMDTLQFQSNNVMLTDTNKKMAIKIMGAHGDPTFYIDGEKSTNADFSKLDPNKIARVEIYKNSASDPEMKNGIVSIVTKENEDSAKVKALLEKLRLKAKADSSNIVFVHKLSAAGAITKARVNGKTYTTTGTGGIHTITGNGNYTFTYTDTARKGSRPSVATIRMGNSTLGVNDKIHKVVINGDTIYNYTGHPVDAIYLSSKSPKRDSLLRAMTGITVTSDGNVVKTVTGYATMGGGGRATAPMLIRSTASMPIKLTDKLIIIDGKEATEKEMKKLSVDKIESVSNIMGEAATAKYGDKAKNGAVIITTKK